MIKSLSVSMALMTAVMAVPASAAVQFTFDTLVANSPTNSAPLVVTVTEAQQANTVFFTVDASAMQSSEFVRDLFFNIDGNTTITSIVDDNGAASYDLCPYDSGCSSGPFNAKGNRGKYDMLLDFVNSNSDNRLSGGETFTMTLTGTNLTEDSFSFGTTSSKYGELFMVAKLQGLSGGESTHMASTGPVDIGDPISGGGPGDPVPTPGAVALFGLAAIGLGLRQRRRWGA
ncbi:MAG: hypothetical protein V2J26_02955 [Pacificimonas sp.]|jgi:hypothetical protein|nr:hypothetical protein [Pacificimonas sp.]